MLVGVFGPSVVSQMDSNGLCILYVAGVNPKTNNTIIQKYSEETNEWSVIKEDFGGVKLTFGFSGLILSEKDRLYIVGGIDKTYKNFSDKVIEYDLNT